MRGRTFLWWILGLVFAVTLAVVVGQRLSAQAMAIVIGIIAGIAASIPTSLVVVWLTSRLTLPRGTYEAPPRPEPRERPIVVMQAPPAAPAYSAPQGYASSPGYAAPAQVTRPRPATARAGYGGQAASAAAPALHRGGRRARAPR
jgi:hypothetical protein